MANNIEYRKAYTAILDEVYQRASVSGCLTSGSRMVRQGAHAKEIMIPRIKVSGLGDYVRNQGCAQGAIQFSYESRSPDELENLDSYMLKYRKHSLCSVPANRLDGVYVSADAE